MDSRAFVARERHLRAKFKYARLRSSLPLGAGGRVGHPCEHFGRAARRPPPCALAHAMRLIASNRSARIYANPVIVDGEATRRGRIARVGTRICRVSFPSAGNWLSVRRLFKFSLQQRHQQRHPPQTGHCVLVFFSFSFFTSANDLSNRAKLAPRRPRVDQVFRAKNFFSRIKIIF